MFHNIRWLHVAHFQLFERLFQQRTNPCERCFSVTFQNRTIVPLYEEYMQWSNYALLFLANQNIHTPLSRRCGTQCPLVTIAKGVLQITSISVTFTDTTLAKCIMGYIYSLFYIYIYIYWKVRLHDSHVNYRICTAFTLLSLQVITTIDRLQIVLSKDEQLYRVLCDSAYTVWQCCQQEDPADYSLSEGNILTRELWRSWGRGSSCPSECRGI